MTLQAMCEAAARYSDRYDEFVIEDGETMYTEDALHYFNVFRDAINEAYIAVSKQILSPHIFKTVSVPANKQIALDTLDPAVYQIRAVLNESKSEAVAFNFLSRDLIEVFVTGNITLFYHYMPDRLENLTDEPVFNEAAADPNIYISLAVARMWQSEKKMDLSQSWLQQYYKGLSELRSIQGSLIRRIARRPFR